MSYLTAKDIAGMLKLSPRTVAEKTTHRPDFPVAYRFGSVRRWHEDEIKEWIESHREGGRKCSI